MVRKDVHKLIKHRRLADRTRTTALRIAVVLCFVSMATFAQDSDAYRRCADQARTQAEMYGCTNDEAKRLDTELNRIYRELLSKASSQSDAVEKIKGAEKAWQAYRDAYIDAVYPAANKQAEYGSMYPMDAGLVRIRLMQEHLSDLKKLLKQYKSRAQ